MNAEAAYIENRPSKCFLLKPLENYYPIISDDMLFDQERGSMCANQLMRRGIHWRNHRVLVEEEVEAVSVWLIDLLWESLLQNRDQYLGHP